MKFYAAVRAREDGMPRPQRTQRTLWLEVIIHFRGFSIAVSAIAARG
jgi:hypothetical protein